VSVKCSTGKVAHTKAAAKHVAATHRRQWASSMSAYRCDECKHWHIGHTPIRKPREVRR
jgi:hypothetical protein